LTDQSLILTGGSTDQASRRADVQPVAARPQTGCRCGHPLYPLPVFPTAL